MDETTIDELIEEHDAQRTLMRLLLKTQSGSEGRESLFRRLKRSVERHRATEDQELHPALANLLGAQYRADKEHQELEDMLEALALTPLDSPEWIARAEKFVERNSYHINEEENVLFPAIRTMQERERLAKARAAAEGMVPHAPQIPSKVSDTIPA